MNEKLKSLSMWLVIGIVGVLGVFAVVKAATGSWPLNIETCPGCIFNISGAVEAVEGLMGSSGTRFPHGLSADSTSPVEGEVRGTTLTSTGDVTVGDDLTVTGDAVSVEGFTSYYDSQLMTTATTTICAVQSPSVTSTLDFASVLFTISSTTDSVITLAKSANAFVTTTLIGNQITVTANTQDLIIASTTVQDADGIFKPSQWFVVGMQGNPGNFSPTGYCKAVFKALNN